MENNSRELKLQTSQYMRLYDWCATKNKVYGMWHKLLKISKSSLGRVVQSDTISCGVVFTAENGKTLETICSKPVRCIMDKHAGSFTGLPVRESFKPQVSGVMGNQQNDSQGLVHRLHGTPPSAVTSVPRLQSWTSHKLQQKECGRFPF